MKKICAWCGKILEENTKTEHDTHGICKKCADCVMGIKVLNCPECRLKNKKDKICLKKRV